MSSQTEVPAPSPEEPRDLLRETLWQYFHFPDFREGQREPIDSVLAGRDCVVVMPTGAGKSLCFQMAALMLPGTTLVVSPLIALMKDQIDALDRIGIPASFVNSSIPPDEMNLRLSRFERGEYKLLYIAPERLRSESFLQTLQHVKISLLAIDEAHCISQWGHDFRPDYSALSKLTNMLGPEVRVMAVTATATPDVRRDIIDSLGLSKAPRSAPDQFVRGFARPNLYLSVVRCESHDVKYARIRKMIEDWGTGIIYCATRKKASEVYQRLIHDPYASKNITPLLYSGALSDDNRTRVQEQFLKAEKPVVVATNAFGMGIDRPDIRFVAHWDVPGSIEAYYQEVGRAGRDGAQSHCELLFNYADVRTQQFFVDMANPQEADIYATLFAVERRCEDGKNTFKDEEIAFAAGIKESQVRNIIAILERLGILTRTAVQGDFTSFQLTMTPGFDASRIEATSAGRKRKREFDQRRLDKMLTFVDARRCRQAFILDYFGEKASHGTCNGCDKDMPGGMLPRLSDAQWVVIQKTLSCVARMKGNYSLVMVCNVLMGQLDIPILEHKLNELSTFGLLKDKPYHFLKNLLLELRKVGCISFAPNPEAADDPLPKITPFGLKIVHRLLPAFSMRWPSSSLNPFPKNDDSLDFDEEDPTPFEKRFSYDAFPPRRRSSATSSSGRRKPPAWVFKKNKRKF